MSVYVYFAKSAIVANCSKKSPGRKIKVWVKTKKYF